MKQLLSSPPDLKGLSPAQHAHVLKVFPETRTDMANYLRSGAQVIVGPQSEASPDVPPIAISVLAVPDFWIDCCDSVEEAHQRIDSLGLVLAAR